MRREISAGGLVLRETLGTMELAVIRPRGKPVWALPKGHVDPGETPEEAAAREVLEETALVGRLEREVGVTRYAYHLHGQHISKSVHFYLFAYVSGEIGRIAPSMRIEVSEARWIPLSRAPRLLTYRGEREMAMRVLTWQDVSAQAAGK